VITVFYDRVDVVSTQYDSTEVIEVRTWGEDMLSLEPTIVQGDALKTVRFRIRSKNDITRHDEPFDLTNCTAQAKYTIGSGALKTKDLVIVTPAADGLADLEPAADNWDAAGIVKGRLYITNLARVGITPEEFEIEVVEPWNGRRSLRATQGSGTQA
jgi:hypothetical protein